MKLSVIVPVYNVEEYLEKCLNSILSQSFTDYELILVNDGSTDASKKICLNFANLDSRIVYLEKENGGLSSARNMGLTYAKGEYISFIDSDDWIEPEMFLGMISDLTLNDADIVICGHYVRSMEGLIIEKENKFFETKIYNGIKAAELVVMDNEIQSFAWNKIYKKKLFNGIKFPVGRLYEDIAVAHEILFNARKVILSEKFYYNYLRREGSICLDPNKANKRIKDLYWVFKERYLFVKKKKELNEIFHNYEKIFFLRALNFLHFLIKNENTNSDEYRTEMDFLKTMDILKNPIINWKVKFEYLLFSNFRNLYILLIKLFYYLKK